MSVVDRESVYLDGYMNNTTVEHRMYTSEEIPFDENDINVDITFDIAKANTNEDEGLVSGWANVSVNADGSIPIDWQDDVISTDTLEKAAVDFMLDYRESGVMHKGGPQGIVVESIVMSKAKQAAMGIPEGTVPEGWFITVKVLNDDVFAKVKDGTFKMFSIQGKAKRVKI